MVVDRDHGVIYQQGFGWADRKSRRPFTVDTILNIGSVSKTLIGVALMQAVEKELVDLDAPVDSYLPYRVRNPRFPDRPITLRQLATHTSSILDREKIYIKSYSRGYQPKMPLGEYLRNYFDPKGKWYSAKNFAEGAPGEVGEYTNIGAALAAYVLERVEGKPFDELTRESILKPLAMASGWSHGRIDGTRHATLYDGKKVVDPYTLVTYPDGGLRASAGDLSRYLLAMLGAGILEQKRILNEDSVAAMVAPQLDVGDSEVGLKNKGIFWSINQTGQIGHTGGDPGIATAVAFDQDSGRGWIFLTNGELSEKNADSFRAIWALLKEYP